MLQLKRWKDKKDKSKNKKQNQEIQWNFFKSSFGFCLAAWTEEGLCSLSLHPQKNHKSEALSDLKKRFAENPLIEMKSCPWQLLIEEYISGSEPQQDLPLVLKGTDFQWNVWKQLSRVPKKKTTTYKQLAEKVGSPDAYRAVGSAVGANPVAILIPCHRVLRKDDGIGGYRWGLEAKKVLLSKEGIIKDWN